ncbi:hypothetical protein COOONC_27736 [Cooperia oncophora]
MCCTCFQFVCAFFAPPLAVLCHSGCTMDLVINVLLTLCGIIPGIVHALYVICQEDQQGIVVATTVNVAQPLVPMQQPVQPPSAPVYYSPAAPPPPPVYYSDVAQKY